jgi:hypothetical protein
VSISATAVDGGLRRSIVLRAALALPLLFVFLDNLPGHWGWIFPSGQALDFYVVNGLLYGIPMAVWALTLVLLVVGSTNRILWVVVCVGGMATAIYGLLFVFEVEPRLNADVAFGFYAALLGLWQLLSRRGRDCLPASDSQA